MTIINVTLTDRCLAGYCNQRGSYSDDNEYIYTLIVRRLGRIVSYVYGLDDTIIINQLMYGIRQQQESLINTESFPKQQQ